MPWETETETATATATATATEIEIETETETVAAAARTRSRAWCWRAAKSLARFAPGGKAISCTALCITLVILYRKYVGARENDVTAGG